MKYLIDTQALAYYLYAGKQLPKSIKDFIDDYENMGYVSVVSLHEIVVKNAKGQIIVPEPIIKVIPHIRETNLDIIPINFHHVIRLETLERDPIHKDPFDRLLIAQCIEDRLTFITSDGKAKLYEKYGLYYIQYDLN